MLLVRSSSWRWTAVGLVATSVAVIVVAGLVDSGDDQVSAVVPEPTVLASASTTPTSEPQAAPSSTSTTSPPVSVTSVPVTTTTVSPTPTTSGPQTTTTGETVGYTSVPKPDNGPNRVAPGGALTKHLAADIAIAFGFDVGEVESAIAQVDLPDEADGNPEGWLAPGTYQLPEGAGVEDLLRAMVDRRASQLEERGIPRDQWHRVLTAASVIEKETYNQSEKPRVARVLTNRLDGGGPLQMDSIILYPTPDDRIFTTSAERASDQPYNSYRHNGLPPTPICSPDEESIDAFLAPPPGDSWFYVTIDLDSGETRYAVTFDDHQANVVLLRAWLDANPTE